MTDKPRISAKQTAEIQEFALELIPRIADFAGDIAMEVVANFAPDKLLQFEANEEFLMNSEDTLTGIVIDRILQTIRREI